MGNIYRPTVTKPLPAGAELFTRKGERFARWRGKGRTQTAPVTVPTRGKHAGHPRIVVESSKFVARYRDIEGGLHVVPTGCRDETAALGVLRELERKVELVKGNVLTKTESRTAEYADTPLATHLEAFEVYLKTKASSKTHRDTVIGRLERLVAECDFQTLRDLERTRLETWLAKTPATMSARTRNGYITALTTFCNWAVSVGRLSSNPFSRTPRANERADQRRPRRALTTGELVGLIGATLRRPLAEHGRKPVTIERQPGSHRKRSSWTYETLTPANIDAAETAAMERLKHRPGAVAEAKAEGQIRALVYKTLALTGLRLNELRSLTVGGATLTGPTPYAVLKAADEKARRGAEIILRADLAADLARHLEQRLLVLQNQAKRNGQPVPLALPADAPLLKVPDGLVKIMNRDLKVAGIAKRDSRGRGIDVHSLRHTFNSLLAAAGVPLTTRQILMRHARNTVTDDYTDVSLIDLRGALSRLPLIPVDDGRERLRATGTHNAISTEVIGAPVCDGVCFTDYKPVQNGASADASGGNPSLPDCPVSAESDKSCRSKTTAGTLHRAGVEPATFGSVGRCSIQLS